MNHPLGAEPSPASNSLVNSKILSTPLIIGGLGLLAAAVYYKNKQTPAKEHSLEWRPSSRLNAIRELSEELGDAYNYSSFFQEQNIIDRKSPPKYAVEKRLPQIQSDDTIVSAVEETGSFKGAAKKLGVTSKTIQTRYRLIMFDRNKDKDGYKKEQIDELAGAFFGQRNLLKIPNMSRYGKKLFEEDVFRGWIDTLHGVVTIQLYLNGNWYTVQEFKDARYKDQEELFAFEQSEAEIKALEEKKRQEQADKPHTPTAFYEKWAEDKLKRGKK